MYITKYLHYVHCICKLYLTWIHCTLFVYTVHYTCTLYMCTRYITCVHCALQHMYITTYLYCTLQVYTVHYIGTLHTTFVPSLVINTLYLFTDSVSRRVKVHYLLVTSLWAVTLTTAILCFLRLLRSSVKKLSKIT